MSEYSVGEFRGWFERHDAEVVSRAEVLDVLRAVTTLSSPGERAYCVSSLIRAGVVELRFFFVDRTGATSIMHWLSPVLLRDCKRRMTGFRPGVYPVRLSFERFAWATALCVDVFPNWPDIPVSQLPLLEETHEDARATHIGAYFRYFAPFGLDRKSLLWAAGSPPAAAFGERGKDE